MVSPRGIGFEVRPVPVRRAGSSSARSGNRTVGKRTLSVVGRSEGRVFFTIVVRSSRLQIFDPAQIFPFDGSYHDAGS